MAVILIEGFDHLTVSELTSKGWSNSPSSMQPGRFDGQCSRITQTTAVSNHSLPSSYSTLIGGFAFRTSALPSATQDFFRFEAGTTATARIGLTSAGLLQVRNSGGTVIATGTTNISINTWVYIEMKIVIGASGTCEVHLNGASEIASTVGNFGTSNLDTIQYLAQNFPTGTVVDFDDMYVLDTTGAAPRNTFLGDVRVETIYPTGAGAHTAWTPNGAATNFGCVDEAQADGDTTYVSDATPGDIDTYAFGDIDGGATVYGVQVNLYARKDDANVRQIAPVIRQSATDNVGTTVTLASSYVTYSQIYNQDPTAADWTPTAVNADEFGVKEIA